MFPIPYTGLQIASGQAPGYSFISKFGRNLAVSTSFEDLWIYGGDKTLTSTAATYYISSSSTSDTGVILVIGLDANWNIQEQVVTLAGRTKTEIGSGLTWIDVYRGYNMGSAALVGDVYIYENDALSDGVPDTATKVRAKITIGYEQTEQAVQPVPVRTKGYISSFWCALSLGLNKTGTADLLIKPFGETWKVKSTVGFSGSAISYAKHPFDVPIEVESKSFIKIRTKLSASDDVSGGFDIVFIKQGGL